MRSGSRAGRRAARRTLSELGFGNVSHPPGGRLLRLGGKGAVRRRRRKYRGRSHPAPFLRQLKNGGRGPARQQPVHDPDPRLHREGTVGGARSRTGHALFVAFSSRLLGIGMGPGKGESSAVFLLSAATMAYEIILVRLLSVSRFLAQLRPADRLAGDARGGGGGAPFARQHAELSFPGRSSHGQSFSPVPLPASPSGRRTRRVRPRSSSCGILASGRGSGSCFLLLSVPFLYRRGDLRPFRSPFLGMRPARSTRHLFADRRRRARRRSLPGARPDRRAPAPSPRARSSSGTFVWGEGGERR